MHSSLSLSLAHKNMGIESQRLSLHSDKDSQAHSNKLPSESSTLYTQPSLPSVPSLTSEAHPRTHHHLITTLKGHTAYVSSLVLDGKFLYTGSSNNEIRSWDRNPFNRFDHSQLNNVVAIGKGAVKSIVVLADKLLSAHQDQKIRIWKINNDDPDKQKYTHLATLPTLSDRALKFLNPNNRVLIRRHKRSSWVNHVDAVSALAISKDESFLYSVSWDRTIKIWKTSNFKCLESVTNAHDDAINAVALSSDGKVYTGSADRKIKVWFKNEGEKKHSLVDTLEKHNSGINALALSIDGLILYSGACDRSILVWEKQGGDSGGAMAVVGALRGHKKAILCLTVVGDLVCSGSADKTVRIWTGVDRSYSCLAVFEGHKGPVKCLTAASHISDSSETSSYLVYSGSLDCDIKVWQISVPLP